MIATTGSSGMSAVVADVWSDLAVGAEPTVRCASAVPPSRLRSVIDLPGWVSECVATSFVLTPWALSDRGRSRPLPPRSEGRARGVTQTYRHKHTQAYTPS